MKLSTNKTKKILIALGIFMSIGLNYLNGQQDYFITSPANNLMFQQKKDLLFSFGGMKDDTHHLTKNIDVQLGYSPLEHLGISISHSRFKVVNEITQSVVYQHSHVSGVDIRGYGFAEFKPKRIQRRITKTGLFINVSVGYSIGQLNNNYYLPSSFNSAKINLQKSHLEVSLHYLMLSGLQIGASLRKGKINYYKGIISGPRFFSANGSIDKYHDIDTKDKNDIHHIVTNNSTEFMELAFVIKYQFRNIGIYYQITSGETENIGRNFQTNDLGLIFNIGGIKKYFNKRRKG